MKTLVTIEPFVFNLLCIPAMATLSAGDQKALVASAATFCAAQHAFLLVDPPATTVDRHRRPGPDRHGVRPAARTPRSTTRGC